MKKIYKYGLLLASIIFLGYHSVYFEKLSERKAKASTEFDYAAYADSIYYQGMLKKTKAIDLQVLLSEVRSNKDQAFEQYGNRLGIGNSAYFMVKCVGVIAEKTTAQIRLNSEINSEVLINTQHIFGNALRDASGLVKLTDFKTNAEFNKVSEALNALIRKQVMPPVLEQLQVGDTIQVEGALKLSKKAPENPGIIITPAQIAVL